MTFQFRPALRDTTSVLIALAGASGSGKTYTAVNLALGLAYPDMSPDQIIATVAGEKRSRIAVIDTEGGRSLHYAAKPGEKPDFKSSFPFDHAELHAPFTPGKYEEAITAADEAGYAVIVVDSASHEYEGPGGLLEWADELAAGKPKPGIENPEAWKREHWIEQPVKSPGNWIKPKSAHKRMVNRAVQCRAHLIFCLRAEEKMLLVQKQEGNRKWTEVVPAADRPVEERWQPICEKRFMYEMTASFVLLPSEPGMGVPLKLQEQHRACFPEGQRIGAKAGNCLAHWASGNTAQEPQQERQQPPAEPQGEQGTSAPPADGKPEQERQARIVWANGYRQKLDDCRSLDAVSELLDENRRALDKMKGVDPDLYREIAEHQNEVVTRLEDSAP